MELRGPNKRNTGYQSWSLCTSSPLCSSLSAEVGLQHSGYRERKDQTDPVGPGPVGPVGPDQLTQEVPVAGSQIVKIELLCIGLLLGGFIIAVYYDS